MTITYLGKSLVKIQSGDFVLAINPPAKDAGGGSRFGADITMVSRNNKDYNGVENTTYGNKTPFVIDGPGEYEIKNIYIKGVMTEGYEVEDKDIKKEKSINTAYVILFDAIRICHMGGHRSSSIDSKVKEELGEIDILFVPIGDGGLLGAVGAYRVATTLEAKVIIPINYEKTKSKDNPLSKFLEEFGSNEVVKTEKYSPKKKEIEEKEGEVIVLTN